MMALHLLASGDADEFLRVRHQLSVEATCRDLTKREGARPAGLS